ncbi:MAG: heme-binding domain-containing protein, partial [Flavobacteriaceae bacterium]
MKNMVKKALLLVGLIFIGMQFYRPEKNISETYSTSFFENETNPPAPILTTLQSKCYDCHSNNTEYPWYNNIAPVSYWIDAHVEDGKKHLNFSNWEQYST